MNQKLKKIVFTGTLTTISAGALTTGLAPAAHAAPSTTNATATASKYTVKASLLNVRSGAGTKYKIITTVKKNSALIGTISNGWLKISAGPYKNDYVSAAYLTKTSITPPVVVAPKAPTTSSSTANTTTTNSAATSATPTTTPTNNNISTSKTYSVNIASLNIRNGAGTSYSVMSSAAQNTQLTGTITNGWLQINSGVYKGKYVSSTYLTEVSNATTVNNDNAQTAIRASIISLAASNAGTPYLWGGNTPGVGLDCSGLTSWVYRQIGITIPRVANDQANFATPVSAANAQAGDLVFLYDSTGHTYHTGILIDPVAKTYWEAPQVGDIVRMGSFAYTNNYKFGAILK